MSGIALKPKRAVKHQNKNVAWGKGNVQYSTVALIGPDGAGKTTVAKAVLETCPLSIKYLYMGVSIESSNVALPTSRLIQKWKTYKRKKAQKRSRQEIPKRIKPAVKLKSQSVQKERGMFVALVRLLHRISELAYRQIFSWFYQLRGHIVLYDRHFLFELCPVTTDTGKYRFTDRVYYWFLQKLYPRPELVIFLDAPTDVMYERKKEQSITYLNREYKKLRQKSYYSKKFVRIDSSKPLEEVVEIVNETIRHYCMGSRVPEKPHPDVTCEERAL